MSEREEEEKRFIVDDMLGKLAKWLRVLGFDTRCERFTHQDQLEGYRSTGALLITRSRRWCDQPQVLCLSADDPMEQLREVISRVPIAFDQIRSLHRCILCNRPLQRLAREEAFGLVPDYVFETNTLFFQCPDCRRVYWPGSHPKRMMERLHQVLGWPMGSQADRGE